MLLMSDTVTHDTENPVAICVYSCLYYIFSVDRFAMNRYTVTVLVDADYP